ncbi:MAG: methyltransferase type 12 [Betaproteobacteria bacterium]|nr:methyltransferase type 12 [Betaproteobacteria bacterium]
MSALKALAAQFLAWVLAGAGYLALGLPLTASLPLAVVQGILAASLGALLRAEPWWIPIHLIFSPALVLALRLDLPPGLYLAVLAGLTFVFWTTFRGEVPLFLSSRAVAEALLGLLPQHAGLRVIDLGAGSGGLLRRLARARPEARFTGIEHAPLPYFLARLNARGLVNLVIRRSDLWREPLHGTDVVFVFLSPRVMPRLWEKTRAEMRPGALLVSSSFPVPEAEPERVVEVADRRGTKLYCYRM